MLIDSHCHLYLEEFKDDLQSLMQRAFEAGLQKFYMPAIDSTTTAAMFELEKIYPGVCIAMAGLHPCSVKENYEEEIAQVSVILTQRKFAAIGEIGLDFYWSQTFEAKQYDAFHRQIEFSLKYELPIVIHTRSAMQETIKVVSEYAGKARGIFHCFGGSIADAEKIIDLGYYLGIGGVVTYKNSGLAETIKNISLQHIVLETDAPYLSPVPFRGKRNESSYLTYIQEKISIIKNVSMEEVAAVTTANALKIFAL
jgi:TatD DNase family protein